MKNGHLAAEFLGLAKWLANRECGSGFEFCDLEGAAIDGLLTACRSYDGRIEFKHWAALKIRGAIQDFKRVNGSVRTVRYDKEDPSFVRKRSTARHKLGDLVIRREQLQSWHGGSCEILGGVSFNVPDRAYEPLTVGEHMVIRLRFVEGLKAQQVAKRMGWSQTGARVHQVSRAALDKLRAGLARRGVHKLSDIL